MIAVTAHSDSEAQENKICHFPLSPHLFAMKWWDRMPWFQFYECWGSSQLFHSSLSLTLIKRLFKSFSLSAIRVVSSAYLRLLIFLLAILIPVCSSSSLAFHMMYSAQKLNKQGDDIRDVLLSKFNQSVVPCSVLPVASWPA